MSEVAGDRQRRRTDRSWTTAIWFFEEEKCRRISSGRSGSVLLL